MLKQGDKLEVLATNRLDDDIDASPAGDYESGASALYVLDSDDAVLAPALH